MIGLRYISWGDAEVRWKHVLWPMEHEDELLQVALGS
jgi:hypothetical protein